MIPPFALGIVGVFVVVFVALSVLERLRIRYYPPRYECGACGFPSPVPHECVPTLHRTPVQARIIRRGSGRELEGRNDR